MRVFGDQLLFYLPDHYFLMGLILALTEEDLGVGTFEEFFYDFVFLQYHLLYYL